jgi:hypothetical protein
MARQIDEHVAKRPIWAHDLVAAGQEGNLVELNRDFIGD